MHSVFFYALLLSFMILILNIIFLLKNHLFQLYRSDEFRAYDWGSEAENMRHYNQVSYSEGWF